MPWHGTTQQHGVGLPRWVRTAQAGVRRDGKLAMVRAELHGQKRQSFVGPPHTSSKVPVRFFCSETAYGHA